jgi:hypothetical protein
LRPNLGHGFKVLLAHFYFRMQLIIEQGIAPSPAQRVDVARLCCAASSGMKSLLSDAW